MPASSLSTRSPHVLVGRERETERLVVCSERARQGQGAIVLVAGEAGIGKSSLVKQAGAGSLVLTGHCYEFAAAPPYGPWREIVEDRRLAETHPRARDLFVEQDTGAPKRDQHELFSAVWQAIAELSETQPLTLIFEDMHWSDTGSLDLLRAIARRTQEQPILVVVTYRDDDLTRDHPLYQLLPFLLREVGAERIHLERLTADATDELVRLRVELPTEDHLSLAHYVNSRAQGNPFFTVELLSALEEQKLLHQADTGWRLKPLRSDNPATSVPILIRQVVDARLDRLGGTTRRLLEIAAVIGQDVPVDLWDQIMDVDAQTFNEAVRRATDRAFLLESADGRHVSFSHALVRDVLYSNVTLPERQQLHRRVGDALVSVAAPDPEQVAHHFARAGDPRAIEWLTRAGERALELYVPMTAIGHFNRAFNLAEAFSVEPAPHAFRSRGHAHAMLGSFERAYRDYMTALEIARTNRDNVAEWHTLEGLGMLWSSRNYVKTREFFDNALDLARQIDDDALVAHSLNRVGNWFVNDDQSVAAIRFHEEALEIFKRTGNAHAIAQTTDLLGLNHLARGDLATSSRLLRSASDDFSALGDRIGLCSSLTNLLLTTGALGFDNDAPEPVDPVELEKTIADIIDIARDTHWRSGEAYACVVIAAHHGVRGRYDLALDFGRRGYTIAGEIEHREWLSVALKALGQIHHEMLQMDRARQYFERSIELATTADSTYHRRIAVAQLAGVYVTMDDVAGALRLLERAFDAGHPMETEGHRACWFVRAVAARATGDADRTLRILDQLREATPTVGSSRIVPRHALLKGEALTDLQHYPEAEAALWAAQSAASELGFRPVLWRIWRALGNLYTVWERSGEATDCYVEGRAIIGALAQSIPDDASREHFLQAALDEFPPPRKLTILQAAKQESGGLTARQRDVAMLIAHGYTNAQIASEMSISKRTVEGHVAGIMTTLNVSSRAQIAAWTVNQGLAQLP